VPEEALEDLGDIEEMLASEAEELIDGPDLSEEPVEDTPEQTSDSEE